MSAEYLTLTLRMPRAVREALDLAADRDSRSVNSYVNLLLVKHLGDLGVLKAAPTTRSRAKKGGR